MLAAAVAAMFVVVSCGEQYEKPIEGSRIGFALSFFKNVDKTAKPGEKIVVSPYSAGVALSMVAEGAQGQTRVEFDNALNGCIFKAEDLGSNDTVTVKSANSVWVTDDFSIRNRYVALLEKDFDDITSDEITTITAEDIVVPEKKKCEARRIGFC